MNSGPRVTVTKEIVKMEDFYPLTFEELPELSGFLEEEKRMFLLKVGDGEVRVSFLARLAIIMLNDLDSIRKLNGSLPGSGRANDVTPDVYEGFLGIVKEWLEANGGRGNLLQITEALRSNGNDGVTELLEQFFLRYSLPMSAKDDEGRDNNVYSLSKGFLQEEQNGCGVNGSKSAMDVNSSVKRALQNSVILEQVFKKLQPREQRAFRLVTPTCKEETLSFWRKSAKLRIEVFEGDSNLPTGGKKGIAMSSYMNMVELDSKLQESKRGKASGSNYDLVKHPFHRYQLSYYKAIRSLIITPTTFFCGPVENKFWKLCGPQIEDLQIEDARFSTIYKENSHHYYTVLYGVYNTCEMLLLDTCPSLKKLKISSSCKTTSFHDNASLMMEMKALDGKQGRRKSLVKKQDFAGNLHTLIFGMKADYLGKILSICPNLKTLVLIDTNISSRSSNNIYVGNVDITGLLRPTVTGEYIKLETLKINYPCYGNRTSEFVPLKNYAELLANKQFHSLQHLSLDGVHLSDARNTPFNLYAALAHCSRTLKSLNLRVHSTGYFDGMSEERKWVTDLSPFSFPNLTLLKFCIDFDCRRCGLEWGAKNMKFDFRTLEGMRMLEQLEIRVGDNGVRNPGAQDWICEGNRTSFLPSGIDFALNKDTDPILCSNLKKFTFIGWGLNKEDIPLLSSWFPNLTLLDAVIKPDAVPVLLDNWSKLEKIEIKTDSLISLRELRPLMEKKKQLRIIQTISWSLGQTKRVELKESNGMLYFYENAEVGEEEDYE